MKSKSYDKLKQWHVKCCLTVDNVPKNLYKEVVANDAQYEERRRS